MPWLSSGRPELTGHWALGGSGRGEGPDRGGRLGGIHHLLSPWREGFLCRDREGLKEWPLAAGSLRLQQSGLLFFWGDG